MSLLPNSKPVNNLLGADIAHQANDIEAGSPAIPAMSWQRELAGAIRNSDELLSQLGLTEFDFPETLPSRNADFPLLVPQSFINRMKAGDARDPLLLQVLPVNDENSNVAGFVPDAVGDQASRTAPGLLHKYRGRALLIAAGSCAVHCRYCFRREYPYDEEPHRMDDWDEAIDALSQDSSVSEVILSGGDPLMLPDSRLGHLVNRVDAIDHIRRIRFHTRLPIVLPSRVTSNLRAICTEMKSQAIIVVHANHANEIQADCHDAVQTLTGWGVPVLNQTVLLSGINDTAPAQINLSRALIDIGVMPYYLHQLDRVSGTSHFEVPLEAGRRIIEEMRCELPGYGVPRLVQEIPGELSKTPLEIR